MACRRSSMSWLIGHHLFRSAYTPNGNHTAEVSKHEVANDQFRKSMALITATTHHLDCDCMQIVGGFWLAARGPMEDVQWKPHGCPALNMVRFTIGRSYPRVCSLFRISVRSH